jgi:mycothiol system anti-sigma-R factor
VKRRHDYSSKIQLYLDKELDPNDLDEFRLHLETCRDCKDNVESERELLDLLRSSLSFYPSPASLRERIEKMLSL